MDEPVDHGGGPRQFLDRRTPGVPSASWPTDGAWVAMPTSFQLARLLGPSVGGGARVFVPAERIIP
jgi:hypothetical protein